MKWQVKTFNALTNEELYEVLRLRVDVFVVEQACPYPEIDGKDLEALHLMAKEAHTGKIVAYSRLLAPGVSYEEASLGRVIVASEWRKTGVGLQLLQKAVERLLSEYGPTIQIGAQAHLEAYYEKVGFVKNSDVYLEDDIPHIDMLYAPASS